MIKIVRSSIPVLIKDIDENSNCKGEYYKCECGKCSATHSWNYCPYCGTKWNWKKAKPLHSNIISNKDMFNQRNINIDKKG